MDHDLIVVGGGAAGLGAVRAALWAGADVALVTDSAPGGDCTFTGCVPSKTLLAAARDGMSFTDAMARVRSTVEHIAATESIEVLEAEGATVIEGRGRLVTHDTVAVGDRRITAPRIVLATGSRPSLPDDVVGLAESQPLTNETVFDLTEAPESLGIIGGGSTGCELAQAFTTFGAAVTLFEAGPQLLGTEEPEAAALVRAALQECGVSVRRLAQVVRVEPASPSLTGTDGPYRVIWQRGHSAAATDPVMVERLLVAAGRVPVTEGLGLEEMRMRLSPHGHVVTDDRLATSIKGVYAAGDVTAWPPPPACVGRRLHDHLVERGVIDSEGRMTVPEGSEQERAALAEAGFPRGGTLLRLRRSFGDRLRGRMFRTLGRLHPAWRAKPSAMRFGVEGDLSASGPTGPLRRRLRIALRDRAAVTPRQFERATHRHGGLLRRLGLRKAPRHRFSRLFITGREPSRADLRRAGLHRAGFRGSFSGGPRVMLSHAADEMGRIAVGNALGKGLRGRFRGAMVPRVVFTDPEVATVGIACWHAPPDSRVAYLPLAELDRAVTDGRTDGFIAIVAGPRRLLRNAGGGRILGATIVAPRAGEMIAEIVLAMRTGAFSGRLAQTSHAYPTWSSGVQKAAAQFFGEIEGRRARRIG